MSPLELFWNSLYQPIRIGNQVFAFSIATVFTEFLLPIGLFLVAGFFATRWFRRYLRRPDWSEDRKTRLMHAWVLGLRIIGGLLILTLGSRFVEVRVVKFFEDLFSIISRPFYHSGATEISLLTLILAIPVFYVATLAGKASKLAFERSKLVPQGLHDNRRAMIANLLRYVVLALILVFGLSMIGLDLSSISIFLAVIGVAIGLGMQQTVASFCAGLLIIVTRPVQEKDFVLVKNGDVVIEGPIIQIRMVSSTIRTRSGGLVVVPNSVFFNHMFRQYTSDDAGFPIGVSLCLSPDNDVERIEKLVSEATAACPGTRLGSSVATRIIGFYPWGVEVSVELEATKGSNPEELRAWLNRELWLRLRAEGVVFAGSSASAATKAIEPLSTSASRKRSST